MWSWNHKGRRLSNLGEWWVKGRHKGGVDKSAFVCVLNCVWLFAVLWTVACRTPLSMGLSRQEYWNMLPFSPPGISRPRDRTSISCVSCIGRQILYYSATWEAQKCFIAYPLPKKKRALVLFFFFFKLRKHWAHIYHSYESVYSYSFLSVLKLKVLSHFIPWMTRERGWHTWEKRCLWLLSVSFNQGGCEWSRC